MVAHRSPLGVAGVPPSVATVRGTAGPEPMAMYLGHHTLKNGWDQKKPWEKKHEPMVANLLCGGKLGGGFCVILM